MQATTLRPARGFTLVEVLVGLTLGLIAIIVMYQVFAVFENQKRTTSTGSDAQTTGLISLYSLEREARMAGYGLVYNNPINDTTYEGQMLCNWMRYTNANGGAATVDRMMPVIIEENVGQNGSDRLTIMYGTSPFAPAPAILSVDVDQGKDLIVKNAPISGASTVFETDDLVMIGAPQSVTTASTDNVCTLLRVSAVAPTGTDVTLTRALATSATLPNRPDGSAPPNTITKSDSASGAYSYTAAASAPAVIVKLGSLAANRIPFVRSHYGISANNELQVRNLTTNGAAQSIGDNVIDLQAQYGLVAQTCPQAYAGGGSGPLCTSVSQWINPPAGGLTNDQIARIKALRVAVVVRSNLRERDIATPNCLPFDGTTNVPTASAPCRAWASDANAPTLAFTAVSSWATNDAAFFRYRVYETVIPLRNMLWGNT